MSRLRTLLASLAGIFAARPTPSARSPLPLSRSILAPGVSAATGHRYGTRIAEGGNPPENWGRSAACAQMVRKNRRRALHVARFESPRRTKGGRKCTVTR